MTQPERIRRQAVLDVGSNSVRLEVADVSQSGITSVHHNKITSRLIEGMQDGFLSSFAIDRTINAIRTLADEAREMGAEYVYAFGTSAVRDGQNRDLLINAARAYGVRFQMLSGAEEAMLAYDAVPKEGLQGVVDIGGGSTEIITGKDGVVQSIVSTQMGAVRLSDMARGSREKAFLQHLVSVVLQKPAADAVATGTLQWTAEGGSATALGCILMGLSTYDPVNVNGFVIEKTALDALCARFCGMTREELLFVPGMEKKRADIIHCSAAILLTAMELLQIETITVSTHDNMISYLNTVVRQSLFGNIDNKIYQS